MFTFLSTSLTEIFGPYLESPWAITSSTRFLSIAFRLLVKIFSDLKYRKLKIKYHYFECMRATAIVKTRFLVKGASRNKEISIELSSKIRYSLYLKR